jgi:hypothetical protein
MNTLVAGIYRCNLVSWWMLVCVPLVFPVGMAYGEAQIGYQMGAHLGNGFDLLDETLKGECVSYEGEVNDGPVAGKLEVLDVLDKESLTRVMNISAAAAYKAMFTKAEGKVDFAKNQSVTQFAHSMAVRYDAKTSGKSIKKARLTDKMAELAKKSLVDFREKCGNAYVAGIATGGEFYGFISIESKNASDHQKLQASFNAQTSNWQVSGALSDEQKSEVSRHQLTVKGWQTGGKLEAYDTPELLLAKWKSYPSELTTGQPNLTSMLLQSYKVLPNFPEEIDKKKTDVVIDGLMTKAWRYQDLLENIEFILSHRDQFFFGQTSLQQIIEMKKQIGEVYMLTIRQIAGDCLKGLEEKCVAPNGLPDPWTLREQLPDRYQSVCGTIPVELPKQAISLGGPNHGDREMAGNNVRITLKATLSVEGRTVRLDSKLRMRESKGDHSRFDGSNSILVFNFDGENYNGCEFDQNDLDLREGLIDVDAGKSNHKDTIYGGTGLLLEALCRSDTPGPEKPGELYCKNITYKPITVRLKHKEDKIGQAAFTPYKKALKGKLSKSREILGLPLIQPTN